MSENENLIETARLRNRISSLRRWIRPLWGRCFVDEIKPIEVEQWLQSLQAEKSKVNLRSLLHLVFQHGRRWEITDVNPLIWYGSVVGADRSRDR